MLRLISSLDKCFLDEAITAKKPLVSASVMKNEVFRFGACYTFDKYTPLCSKKIMRVEIDSPLSEYIRVWRVDHLPVKMPTDSGKYDADYLRTTPGLYPDLLTPLEGERRVRVCENLESLYFELDTRSEVAAGVYSIRVNLVSESDGTVCDSEELELTVIGASLPRQSIKVTQWLHCDCLCNYYGTQSFDERHWQIIENFISVAVEHGINTILTPIFTPPLDTHVGGERTTTQLVDVSVRDGEYTFGFDKLSRWVDMCNRLGVRYFEISHLFTQWGALHAPKIMATVDGEYRQIFGWDTDSAGDEYIGFLRCFLPCLVGFMKSRGGADSRCLFHISDEPPLARLSTYKEVREKIADLLDGYTVIDALSSYEFYEQGVVDTPIVCTDRIEPFIENGVPELWCYYCISQWEKVSNRFISMPGSRTRIIGTQFYKYNVAGFLHWGYNFYNDQGSYEAVDPYVHTDCDRFSPAGDAFSVYPGAGGVALPSMRLKMFHDALQDLAALELCEMLYDRDYVIALMEEGEEPFTFSEYPRYADYIPRMRERINAAIAARC